MRADPGLSIVGVRSRRALRDVLHSVFDDGALDSDSHHIQIELGALGVILARSLRTVAAGH